MFEFELDNSSYFDFTTKDRMDFVIKQNSELPVLEIHPIKTKNFNELLSYIKNCTVTFSMYDSENCFRILDKPAIINLNTPINDYNRQDDSCLDITDFTIQYKFTKKETSKSGVFKGEFKFVFSNNEQEVVLITPIQIPLGIVILPSNIKTTKQIATAAPIQLDINNAFVFEDNTYLLIGNNVYLKIT